MGFNGRVNFQPPREPQYYKYFAFFDWDKCLLGCDLALSDSFSGGGLSLTSPAWGESSCCADGGDYWREPAPCAGGPLKQNIVDGHFVLENNGDGTATGIEATGNYAGFLGFVSSDACALINYWIDLVLNPDDTRGNDQILYGCGPENPSYCCPDVTENIISVYLYND